MKFYVNRFGLVYLIYNYFPRWTSIRSIDFSSDWKDWSVFFFQLVISSFFKIVKDCLMFLCAMHFYSLSIWFVTRALSSVILRIHQRGLKNKKIVLFACLGKSKKQWSRCSEIRIPFICSKLLEEQSWQIVICLFILSC